MGVWNQKVITQICLHHCSYYTCQLSRIMRESHACGSEIVTSGVQTNFSRLTDNSECNCLKTSSKLFNNARDWLEILWKSLPSLFWSHRKSFYTFGYRQKSSENLRKSLETFGDLRKSFEIFGNLRKPSVNRRKFRFSGDENSHAFYWKKVARYII